MEKIIVVGDIHADWPALNRLMTRERPDKVFQCGDFGWWPKGHNKDWITSGEYKGKKFDQYAVYPPEGCTVYFCDGNHEDHSDLIKYKQPAELIPSVFYMPRGSVLTLEDGRNILFMGGSESVDKDMRIPGHSWFPEESITQKNIMALPDCKIDVVVSHTCPALFENHNASFYEGYDRSSQYALDAVWEKYKPSWWYFGHYHIYNRGKFNNTNWVCLNILGFTRGWIDLC